MKTGFNELRQPGSVPALIVLVGVLAMLYVVLTMLVGCGGGDPEDDRVTLDKPDCIAGACK